MCVPTNAKEINVALGTGVTDGCQVLRQSFKMYLLAQMNLSKYRV